jgi:hypothetical protein
MSDKNYKNSYEELLNSQTEEEAFINLKSIVKQFVSSKYKEDILSNPFFKSLLTDVLESVHSDIKVLEQSINKELKNIDKELDKIENDKEFLPQVKRLKELKRECIALIYEIDEKKKDLNSLIK